MIRAFAKPVRSEGRQGRTPPGPGGDEGLQAAEERDGRLVLVQDEGCLGNPSRYDTLPALRKALKRCPNTVMSGYRKVGPTHVAADGWQVEEYVERPGRAR